MKSLQWECYVCTFSVSTVCQTLWASFLPAASSSWTEHSAVIHEILCGSIRATFLVPTPHQLPIRCPSKESAPPEDAGLKCHTRCWPLITKDDPSLPNLVLAYEQFFQSTDRTYQISGQVWANIRLSRHPEPSGHAVHGEVNGLDSGGQQGQRSVLPRHTHRPQ